MARKPMTAAKRKEVAERLAAGRAAAKARKTPDPGAPPRPPTPPTEQPAFMQDNPQPQPRGPDRPSPEVTEASRLTAENELAAVYAGAHFVPAFVLGIPELNVDEETSREMAKRFMRMMSAWGISLDGVATGRIMATLNFGMMFLTVELSKLAIARSVINARLAAQAAAEHQAEPVPDQHGPAPGLVPDVSMGGFDPALHNLAAE